MDNKILKTNPLYQVYRTHDYDEDGCCTKCGFDGAEWAWWKYHTYEGKASNAQQPECIK